MKALLDSRFVDLLVLVATLAFAIGSLFLSQLILRHGVRRLLTITNATWDDILYERGVFEKIAYLAPALVIYGSVSHFAPAAEAGILRALQAYTVGVFVVFADRLLSAINDIYALSKTARDLPIKGYLQIVKLVFYLFGGIVIIAILVRQSPWVFLSGLGAATAVLLLVFKDTILSFVASVQLATNDMIRIGDWIEIPRFDADGEVIDIALHTVKVRNWDLTITTIPTFKLIEDAFKNWRGMQAAGARRIKRAVHIDITSIAFISPDGEEPRITNAGKFRRYVLEWLRANPNLRKDMSLVVRQMAPGPLGLPLEIYAYSQETRWSEFEAIQSEIFEHILAIAPEFGLRIFQSPGSPPRT